MAVVFLAPEAWAGGQAVELSFVRQWEAAQRERPASMGTRASVASTGERGVRLHVRMLLVETDGRTPVAGATVFVYQTDRDGRYDRPERDGWRLKAWARTDADGWVQFDTIRPGPYPGRQVAAHIHVGVDGPPGERHLLPDLLFEGDERLTSAERAKSDRAGRFANIRPVQTRDSASFVEIAYRLPGEFVF